MFERVLMRMRETVRQREYVMTLHAEDEMVDDGYTILDVEEGILGGDIVERQKDEQTGEWKYCIVGRTRLEDEIEIVAKLSPTGKLVIITVYRP